MTKILAIAAKLYDFAGNPKTKNAAILILAVMTAFGITAPDTATSVRDTLLSLAF